MPKWTDDNTIEGATWFAPSPNGLAWYYREDREQAGIAYTLGIVQNRDRRRWVVLERRFTIPEGIKSLLGLEEVLWRDYDHAPQREWSLRRQWEEAEADAERDVSTLLGIGTALETKVQELRAEALGMLKSWKVNSSGR